MLMDGAGADGGLETGYVGAEGEDIVVDLDGGGQASFYDAGGHLVRVMLRGPGSGSLYFASQGQCDVKRLVLDGTSLWSSVTILTEGPQVKTALGEIVISGSLGSLMARTTDLAGDLTATGWVRTLYLADVAGPHTVRMGPSAGLASGSAMIFGRVADLSIESAVTVRSIMATEWLDADGAPDVIQAPSVGRLSVRGDLRSGINGAFQADLILDGSDGHLLTLGGAHISGDLSDADWDITGDVGTISVRGQVDGWTLDVQGGLRSLALGDVTAADVTVDGDVVAARAWRWLTGDLQAATLRSLAIWGDRRAGLAGDFGAALTLTDFTARQTLVSANIRGSLIGAHWGITGDVGTITVGGQVDGWTLDVQGDLRSLALGDVTAADVTVDGDLVAVRAWRWLTGNLQAATLRSLAVWGDRRSGLAGDFGAALTLTDFTARQTFGSANIRGSLIGAHWGITGDVGTIAVGGQVDGWTLDVQGDLRSLVLGDVTAADVTVDGDVGAVRAWRWLSGNLQAATLRSLAIWGDRRSGLAGDFGAKLTLSGNQAARTSGLDSSNVLVIYNAASPEGTQIASYYVQAYPGVRALALSNVPVAEDVSADVYINQIRPQVLGALTDSIDCIVTTKGLPLRIDNEPPEDAPVRWERYSSLESELARIDSIDSQDAMGDQGILNPLSLNPYYGQNQPFAYATYGTRLVTRLDGFTVADVEASIARSREAVIGGPGSGVFVLDDHPDSTDRMELLRDNVLAPGGQPYTYDGTAAFVRDVPGPVMGYVSHGVHGGVAESYIRDPDYGLVFPMAPGAVFHSWESFNAYTFEGDLGSPSPKGQGLVAQWIARGGTAGTGHVEEPRATFVGVANEDIFYQKLLEGYTWAEAAWNGIVQLSFVNTVVGDPLMVWRQWSPGDSDQDGSSGYSRTLGSAHVRGDLTAAEWDITGDVGTITVGGQIDGWSLDVQGGLCSLALGDVAAADVTVDGDVVAVRAWRWLSGNLQAATLRSLAVWGDRRAGLAGDFGADLTLTDFTARQTLGSANIRGSLIGAHWNIGGNMGQLTVQGTAENSTVRSAGSILGIRLGATDSSDFLAGVNSGVQDRASQADDFVNPHAEIRSISIAGLRSLDGASVPRFFFTNSNFSAGIFGTVCLLNADFGSQEHGIHVLEPDAGGGIRSVTWRDTVTLERGSWSSAQGGWPAFVNILQ